MVRSPSPVFGHTGRDTYRRYTRIAFTNECIVSLNYYKSGYPFPDGPTVIQSFTFPPDSSSVTNDNRVLCLTREGVVPVDNFHPVDVEFLKPLVDPILGLHT